MSIHLNSLFFLLFLLPSKFLPISARNHEQEQFSRDCPASHCGSGSLEIRFPLRLRTSPRSCGLDGLELTCSANDTLLALPSSRRYKITHIDYRQSLLSIDFGFGYGSGSDSCPLRNLSSLPHLSDLTTPILDPADYTTVSLVNCSRKFVPDSQSDRISGPISCLSGSDHFVYVVDVGEWMNVIPSDCTMLRRGIDMPMYLGPSYDLRDLSYFWDFGALVEGFVEKKEATLRWSVKGISDRCERCEMGGKFCGFSLAGNQSFCIGNHGAVVKLVAGISVGGLVIILSVSLTVLKIHGKSGREKEARLKVERFLATYKTTNPTRYTYSGIRKITRRFRHKLGQGGFGSVYRGELPDGIPVAVKMLEKSRGEGEEFINEVATIGRIHHVNIVRLLGFCSEGTTHALIYEFMPNESLEKFIFLTEARKPKPFNMEKLQEIARGIARGIEYLHQGCDQRILHFDIKPHNILLDHNFNPKITDFGLAKLCSRDQSIVTMTAARGTMGYIAPEIYSRNFGTVSYKSDVYSFGMLLLEMVSGRKNVDPTIESRSEVYFPEWVYDRLIHQQDLELSLEKGKEEEIAKKLVTVALWCIQWSPAERPSMTRVVQMLMGNFEGLQIPPKPFVSSSDEDCGASANEV